MRLKLPLRIVTLVCAVSLLAYACGDSTSPVEGKPVSLTLLPSEFTLNAVGDTKDLTATVYDALGNVIDTTVQFEPSDPAIVTVTAAGRVTATGVGVASVTASLGSLNDHGEGRGASRHLAEGQRQRGTWLRGRGLSKPPSWAL